MVYLRAGWRVRQAPGPACYSASPPWPALFSVWPRAGSDTGCYLILLFPLAIGAAIGSIGVQLVEAGKVRSPLLGGVAGLFGGVVAMFAMHYFHISRVQGGVGRSRQRRNSSSVSRSCRRPARNGGRLKVHDFLSYLDFSAEQGVQISMAPATEAAG